MKKQRIIIIIILIAVAALVTACAGATPEPTATLSPPTATPVPPTATPEPTPTPEPTSTPSPNASPEGVVNAVFTAARTNDFESLANLCDPAEENDKDTQMICNLATDPEFRDSFIEYFGFGKVTGDASISDGGNLAEVPVMMGTNGDTEEKIKLIKRDGKWYLFSF